MGYRLIIVLVFAALAAAVVGVFSIAIPMIVSGLGGHEATRTVVGQHGTTAMVALLAAIVAAWLVTQRRVTTPIVRLTRAVRTAAYGDPAQPIDGDGFGAVAELARPAADLARALAAARTEADRKVAAATAAAEQQKSRLEATLRDLHEGVVMCNLNHQILLYNQRALQLLHVAGELGLGRSLFTVVGRRPFLHALERLGNRVQAGRHRTHPQGVTVPLVCFTGDGRRTLEGRMSLILDAEERMTGYVFTFDDRTEDLAALGRRDSLLREATEGLQGQVAILRAAAETLVGHPEMEAASRTAFLDAVATESRRLSERLALLTADFRAVVSGHWPMADVDSSNLLACVARRLKEETAIRATVTGIPQWLRGDSHSLVELLDHLVRRLAETARVAEFDLAAEAGERKVYLDVIWRGEPVAAAVLDSWLNVRLEGVGGLTARDVVEHHRTDVWSQPHRDGHARLRMPVPPGLQAQQAAAADRRQLPPRPEFYDFDLLRQPAHPGRLGERRLRELTYVVFDTETTGLEPEKGDEVISIAGVRVVNGRILTGESFDRLVNPGREIPRSSIRFHGITDDMVRDKPPLAVVLPQFKDFAGDAILVGHNAAFDLKFLRLKEEATGIRLDNSVLDTLILAVALGERTPEHSLDALAAQFGIEVDGRHTALGDSLATAAVLLRLIDLMGECGIHTLDDALAASAKAMAQMGVGET